MKTIIILNIEWVDTRVFIVALYGRAGEDSIMVYLHSACSALFVCQIKEVGKKFWVHFLGERKKSQR